MQAINMDLTKQVLIQTNELNWLDSPMAGVQRKQLEREAAESGHVTSLVRYSPQSKFQAHEHPAGEEILVLRGVFSDENGDYAEGSYLRNPPGSKHAPFSREGCLILVKLGQMTPGQPQIVIHSNRHWQPTGKPGYWRQTLYTDPFSTEDVGLEKLEPGSKLPPLEVVAGEEIFVIDGVIKIGDDYCAAGTWVRLPAGHLRVISSDQGCYFWVKRGHLTRVRV